MRNGAKTCGAVVAWAIGAPTRCYFSQGRPEDGNNSFGEVSEGGFGCARSSANMSERLRERSRVCPHLRRVHLEGVVGARSISNEPAWRSGPIRPAKSEFAAVELAAHSGRPQCDIAQDWPATEKRHSGNCFLSELGCARTRANMCPVRRPSLSCPSIAGGRRVKYFHWIRVAQKLNPASRVEICGARAERTLGTSAMCNCAGPARRRKRFIWEVFFGRIWLRATLCEHVGPFA